MVAVWPFDKDYKRFKTFIKKLAVVNDPLRTGSKEDSKRSGPGKA